MIYFLIILNLVLIAIIVIIMQNKELFLGDKHSFWGTYPDKNKSADKEIIKEIKVLQADVKHLKEDVNRIQNQINVVPKVQEHLKKLYDSDSELEKRIVSLEKSAAKQKQQTAIVEKKTIPDPQPKIEPVRLIIESQEPEVIYLKNFRDGILSECKESDAQFKVIQKSGTTASFRFCGDVATAIATKDATFADVCELIDWSNSVRSIKTIEDGQIRVYSEGKWSVIKPAKVKCE
ncbi:MAG: hypothetical protein ACI392_08825 [Paludibacteraceae bacterium]